MLNFQLEKVCLSGVCTIDLIRILLETAHKLSEDVSVLKSDNLLLNPKLINNMKKFVNLRDHCSPESVF
jgi:hypothetical protein